MPPIAGDDLTAIGWTNDAILYGAIVTLLVVAAMTQSLEEIGPRVPSNASPDYGRPFGEIFTRYDNDFYRIDPMLFSPAKITFYNVDTGECSEFGRTCAEVLGGVVRKQIARPCWPGIDVASESPPAQDGPAIYLSLPIFAMRSAVRTL